MRSLLILFLIILFSEASAQQLEDKFFLKNSNVHKYENFLEDTNRIQFAWDSLSNFLINNGKGIITQKIQDSLYSNFEVLHFIFNNGEYDYVIREVVNNVDEKSLYLYNASNQIVLLFGFNENNRISNYRYYYLDSLFNYYSLAFYGENDDFGNKINNVKYNKPYKSEIFWYDSQTKSEEWFYENDSLVYYFSWFENGEIKEYGSTSDVDYITTSKGAALIESVVPKKHNEWRVFNEQGVLIKKEIWDNGVLIETIHY